MKKTGILNSELAAAIASMGHLDSIAIVDLGYPIPFNAKKLDLVVDINNPSIFDIVDVIMRELFVEKFIVAEEASEDFILLLTQITGVTKFEKVPHKEFKERAREAKLYVRTGTAKPYHNVILISGVIF